MNQFDFVPQVLLLKKMEKGLRVSKLETQINSIQSTISPLDT